MKEGRNATLFCGVLSILCQSAWDTADFEIFPGGNPFGYTVHVEWVKFGEHFILNFNLQFGKFQN